MSETITVTIDEQTAEVKFLVSTETLSFAVPGMSVRRASHVEPANPLLRYAFHSLRETFGESGSIADFTRQWSCIWRVNLAPVNGPILPVTFSNRMEAIAAEVIWLEANFL